MVIGLGTDLIQVDELRRALDREDRAWLESTFSAGERDACLPRVDPAPGLAARLAAKNAALRALGHPDGCGLADVEIVRMSSGKPELALHGPARAAADRLGVAAAHVTLTHLDAHALAIVLLEGAPR